MTTPDTSNEGIALTESAEAAVGLETIVPHYLTGLVIIGLAVAFLVSLVGFAMDRFAVLAAGSFALSAVTLAWALAAAVGLGKSIRSWLISRRAAGNGPIGKGPSR
jgi:hypothetical protein